MMVEQYKTVYEGGTGEIVEKKSRFIANVRPVETEEEALAFIEEMKKKYWMPATIVPPISLENARNRCAAVTTGSRPRRRENP